MNRLIASTTTSLSNVMTPLDEFVRCTATAALIAAARTWVKSEESDNGETMAEWVTRRELAEKSLRDAVLAWEEMEERS